jgi:hypothetical protein
MGINVRSRPKFIQSAQKHPYPSSPSYPMRGHVGIASQSELGLDGLFLQCLNLAQLRCACTLLRVILLVDGHHACSTQAQIVLQGIFQVGHLSLGCDASQLPAEFSTLCETGGAEGVSLANESS